MPGDLLETNAENNVSDICGIPQIRTEKDSALYSLDCYLHKLMNRGRKQTTIASYRQIIGSLIDFLDDRELHSSPEFMSEGEIMEIVNHYPISDLSKKNYLSVFSGWLTVTSGNCIVKEMDIMWPSSERPGRRWADYGEAERMFESEKDPINRLILALAMDEGMRAAEIAQMRVGDVNGGWVTVRGKGHRNGKIRSVPMSKRVSDMVAEYLEHRKNITSDDDGNGPILLRKNGKPLSSHTVSQRVLRMSVRNGNDITTHSLRRRFITDTLNSGVRIEVRSKIVGHENPMITALYYDCEAEMFADAMEKRREYLTVKEASRVRGASYLRSQTSNVNGSPVLGKITL